MTQMCSVISGINKLKALAIAGLLPIFTLAVVADQPTNSEPDGATLAQQIRLMEPIENSKISGSLIVKQKRKKTSVPFVCQVVKRGDSWETIFTASGTTTTPAETLIVRHVPGQTNSYLFAKASAPGAALPVLATVTVDYAMNTPFAGSDFALADLGLEFLYWPMQQRMPDQKRLDRLCYVLESANDRSREIVRMRAYIDKEYSSNLGEQGFPALLVAEGYDSSGEMTKKFSLHGSSFKKVNGQYRLKKMEIANEKTGSQTTIEYDLTE